MKSTRTLALLMGLIAIFVIVSCKKTDLKNEPGDNVTGKAPTSIVQQETTTPVILPDCNIYCIDPGGPYVESSGSETKTWGNSQNSHWKTVSYTAYNTPTSFIVEVTFTHSGGNASNTVSVTAYGSTQSVATLASGAIATFTFALPTGWNACDNVPFSIYQEGLNSPMNLSYSYNLYGVCANRGCETSFTGETIDCDNQLREAVYTFTSADDLSYFKIQGGLTNFTGGSAEVTVDGGITTDDQWTPGGSTNRVIKVEGSVTACETITITIKWSSTNSGGIITGNWSVKDQNGVEIAPAVAGLTCN